MSAISYEDMMEILIDRGCHNLEIQVNEGAIKKDHKEAIVLATLAITAQSLDLINAKMNKVVKELDRIATALEQKSHECP